MNVNLRSCYRGFLLLNLSNEAVQTILPLVRSQPGVGGQVLHDVEVIAHLISQTLEREKHRNTYPKHELHQ